MKINNLFSNKIKEKDFIEMQEILSSIKGKTITQEQHNKMLGYAIKYPNSANVSVYFLYLRGNIFSIQNSYAQIL